MGLAVRIRDLSQIGTALLFAVSLASCKDDNKLTGKNMPVPTKSPPTGFEVDTGQRPVLTDAKDPKPPAPDPKKKILKNDRPALTEAEVKTLSERLPSLENSLVLKALAVIPHSRVATMTICIKKPLTEATSQIIRAYREQKWQDLKVETPSHDKDIRRISANDKRYRMTGSVEGGSTIGCPDSDTHSKVSLRFQERSPSGAGSYNVDRVRPSRPGSRRKNPASDRLAPDSESPPPTPPG